MRNIQSSPLWKLLEGSPETPWTTFVVAFAAIAFATWILVKLTVRMRGGDDPAVDDHTMLTRIGELRREGDLTDDEYRSIKGRLVQRLEQKEKDGQPDPSDGVDSSRQ